MMKTNPNISSKILKYLLTASLATISSAAIADEKSPTAERPVIGIQYEASIKVVMQIKIGDMSEGVHKGLFRLRKTVQGYLDAGRKAEDLDIHAVFHGDAADHLLSDEAWNRYRESQSGNPSTRILGELEKMGVDVELCNKRRLKNGWEKSDIHPSVAFASSAYHRIIDLELQGYAYLRL